MIEVQSSGALNIVVDSGRHGKMGMGIGRGGPADGLALRLASILVGNCENAAGIEVSIFPFRLLFTADVLISVTGAECEATLGDRPLPPYWAALARAGETLSLQPPSRGLRAYVGVQGGIDVPCTLGSRSTDLKGGFGGLHGRGLRRGDRLDAGGAPKSAVPHNAAGAGVIPKCLVDFWNDLVRNSVAVRALSAAEYEGFTPESQTAFSNSSYLVTAETNRVGCRLQGQMLTLKSPSELLSHGIVPGTVQVPPSGMPIVQLADANTAGGYPKIATVIEADLWKFGQLVPGSSVSFTLVRPEDAVQALKETAHIFENLRSTLVLLSQRR